MKSTLYLGIGLLAGFSNVVLAAGGRRRGGGAPWTPPETWNQRQRRAFTDGPAEGPLPTEKAERKIAELQKQLNESQNPWQTSRLKQKLNNAKTELKSLKEKNASRKSDFLGELRALEQTK